MTKILRFKIFILLFAITFILSGCQFLPPAPNGNDTVVPPEDESREGADREGGALPLEEKLDKQSKINKFADSSELRDFMESYLSSGAGYGSITGYSRSALGGDFSSDAAPSIEMSAPAAKMQAEGSAVETQESYGGGSDDFSQTNVQVEGVDEADIIKTDGKYVYAVVKSDLYIIKAYPAKSAEALAKIEFKDRPQDIYINEGRLAIFGRDTEIFRSEAYQRFRRPGNYTFFKVFDITNPAEPRQVRDLNFEGSYNNSRLIGDNVYFVTDNYNYYYLDPEPLLPRMIEDGRVIEAACAEKDESKCLFPDVYYFDIPYHSYNFTAINAINIMDDGKEVEREFYMMSGNQNMYVSRDNIYITYTKHISEYDLEMEVMREIVYPRLSQKDQEKIAKIETAENWLLSPDEKKMKISAILEKYSLGLTDEENEKLGQDIENAMKRKYQDISKELEKTVIHKIAATQGSLEYFGSGEVTGQVLNQFSMDERNGYFRIATTKNRTWSKYLGEEEKQSYSNLYVLDGDLKQVGAVENLAPGERIYSVRFMQSRAYMVTFKRMDPLFVIDLSSPEAPRVLGELKIPGFSNYLHPYGDDHLIGFGKDTGENQWGGVATKGLKLSLFDVSDVKNPKEVDVYVMGDSGSNSIALSDHKAFLFSEEKNLLSVPVSINEYYESAGSGTGSSFPRLSFSGAAVFKVSKSGFELKGKIDHSDGGTAADRDYWQGISYYDTTVKRSLYIDNILYTFSNKYLKMNEIGDLASIKILELKKFPKNGDDDHEIIN